MRRPRTGWPKYDDPDEVNFGRLASVFIVWGIIGLLTAWFYTGQLNKQSHQFNPQQPNFLERTINNVQVRRPVNLVGPINVKRDNQSYQISIWANLPVQSWSFIQGEVLNKDKEYLFSFGKELWHETGRDSDGPWRENKNTYSIKVTFPKKGQYYLNFPQVESNNIPSRVNVTIAEKRGSSLPHLWFGMLAIFTGIILNEIRNGTIRRITTKDEDDGDGSSSAAISYLVLGIIAFITIIVFMSN